VRPAEAGQDAPDALAVLRIEAHGGSSRMSRSGGAGWRGRCPADGASRPRAGGPAGPRAAEARLIDGVGHRRAGKPPAQPGEPGGEEQVLLDREQWIDTGLLEQQPDAAADGSAGSHGIVAEDRGSASSGREERAQQQHRRGLAGTVRPEEAEQAAAGQLEVEGVERARLAVVPAEPSQWTAGGALALTPAAVRRSGCGSGTRARRLRRGPRR
jgi:hypothetical protein